MGKKEDGSFVREATDIPQAIPEDQYNSDGVQSHPLEVNSKLGKLFDGREIPEVEGEKWPWRYDLHEDVTRLVTQRDVECLEISVNAYAELAHRIAYMVEDTRAKLQEQLSLILKVKVPEAARTRHLDLPE